MKNGKPAKKKRAKTIKKLGVTLSEIDHPRYRWRVTYPSGAKRLQKYFKNRTGPEGAEQWANDKREEIAKEGSKRGGISSVERRAIELFRDEVGKLPGEGGKKTLVDAVNFYVAHLKLQHRSITVSRAIEDLYGSVRRSGGGERHLQTMRSRLGPFEADYGDWLCCDITPEITQDFLDGLEVSPTTTNNYRQAIGQLFTFAIKVKAAETNAATVVDPVKAVSKEPGIFKLGEVRGLLDAANDDILPTLALGFFGGIRTAELERMDWSEIDFEQGHIFIPSTKSKSAKRRFVTLRDNLRAWLEPLAREGGAVMPPQYAWQTGRDAAMKAARVKTWVPNGMRHSFASYLLAATKDSALVSHELGHASSGIVFEHYRKLVKPKDGAAYWEIVPDPKARAVGQGKVIDLAGKASEVTDPHEAADDILEALKKGLIESAPSEAELMDYLRICQRKNQPYLDAVDKLLEPILRAEQAERVVREGLDEKDFLGQFTGKERQAERKRLARIKKGARARSAPLKKELLEICRRYLLELGSMPKLWNLHPNPKENPSRYKTAHKVLIEIEDAVLAAKEKNCF